MIKKQFFALVPVELKCDYLQNPLGIDNTTPLFSWELQSDEKNQKQTGYRIIVSSDIEKIKKDNGNIWDTGKVKTSQSNNIEFHGKRLKSGERYYWKIKVWDKSNFSSDWSNFAWWEMGPLKKEDWQGIWIGTDEVVSSPLLRKKFNIDKNIKLARAYICGLGYYELYINGKQIDDNVLTPAWTDYDTRTLKDMLYPFDNQHQTSKRVLYLTYDVTAYLKKGENVVGVILGNGWYNQKERNIEGKMHYGIPVMIFQMNIEYTDGTSKKIVSDKTWKTSSGPIIFNNIYYGETYDARLEKKGWNSTGYDDNKWEAVKIMKKPKGQLCSQMCPSDKIIKIIKPIKIYSLEKNVYVCDFGINISGWVQLRVRGKRGTKIILKFSEEIKENRTLNFESTDGENQIQTDTYILKGDGIESYRPRFTWHGFRYAEITGYPGKLYIDNIEAMEVHSSVEKTGRFECSNNLFNKIHKIYTQAQLSNLHGGVPSDCPHRERLGYTGDGQITAESAMYNFNMSQFYIKWLNDIFDAQNKKTGFVPHTAPFYGGGGGPPWGCACIIIPWYVYLFYGNKKIFEKHYSGMKKWIKYLETRTNHDYIISKEEPGSWCLGEWCPVGGEIKIPPELVNTFYYGYVSKIMFQIARILNKSKDIVKYKKLFKNIASAFNKNFFDKEKEIYSIGCQGTAVFPLVLGIVPKKNLQGVLKHLIRNIMIDNKGHLDTGIFGTRFLFDVLVDYGYGDVAWTILNQKTYPGYGYMIKNNATTLWETWEGKGSHNHPMFGSIDAWFYRTLAGICICPEKPGFEKIIIKPHIIGDIHNVNASIKTIKGIISVNWKLKKNIFILKVAAPVNTTMEIHGPPYYTLKRKKDNGKERIYYFTRIG